MDREPMDFPGRRDRCCELTAHAIACSDKWAFGGDCELWGTWCRDLAAAAVMGQAGETIKLVERMGVLGTALTPHCIRFRSLMNLSRKNYKLSYVSPLAERECVPRIGSAQKGKKTRRRVCRKAVRARG